MRHGLAGGVLSRVLLHHAACGGGVSQCCTARYPLNTYSAHSFGLCGPAPGQSSCPPQSVVQKVFSLLYDPTAAAYLEYRRCASAANGVSPVTTKAPADVQSTVHLQEADNSKDGPFSGYHRGRCNDSYNVHQTSVAARG